VPTRLPVTACPSKLRQDKMAIHRMASETVHTRSLIIVVPP
jgi:hypothetical protein